ncbi:MAG: hypothetical protein JNL08_06730 [Planctomycetes bacterium]|nr:hypothetical protein [Planctomycetota bacterium]
MAAPAPESNRQIHRIEAELHRLEALLARHRDLLRRVEEQGMPDATPYVSYRRGTDVLDLRGPAGGIRAAFRNEIAAIQAEVRRLREQVGRARRNTQRQAARAAVSRIDRRFEAHLRRVLADAKRRGDFAPGELEELQRGADEVLNAHVDLLGIDSSETSMRDVLRQFAQVQALGAGDDRVARRAMQALLGASRRNVERAWRRYTGLPSLEAARGVLSAAASCELLGGDSGTATLDIGPRAEQEMKAAEQRFRRTPSAANLKLMLQAERLATNLGVGPLPSPPPGLKRIKAGATHTIVEGDTLSGLAKAYYGSFSWWDVLVRANVELYEDPDRPPRGTIRIPF